MNCPRCNSVKTNPISPYYQNRKFRCDDCGGVFSINDYEWEYEFYHKGVCGRCKQSLKQKEKDD